MTNDESRERDREYRDRDEDARDRDDLARREDAFAQRATKSARATQTWATAVVIIMVAGLFWLVSQEKEAIETMQETATRTEEAAVATEGVLRDILAERQTPEGQAQAQAIRQALADIRAIKAILCAVEAPPEPCEGP